MIFKLFSLVFIVTAASAVQFQLVNNSPDKNVFVQILGTVAPDPFVLEASQQTNFDIPEPWSGRIWGRIDCYSVEECAQAGPIPASLSEMTVGDGMSFYDVSLVDGFNIEISFAPVGGTPNPDDHFHCGVAVCDYPILNECPEELKLFNADNELVSCQAACNVFNDDLYCCRGEHDTPETCHSSDWPVDYAGWFKQRCPDAYSYAYDDQQSTFTCDSDTYVITFL